VADDVRADDPIAPFINEDLGPGHVSAKVLAENQSSMSLVATLISSHFHLPTPLSGRCSKAPAP
jgi:hypothetical protein